MLWKIVSTFADCSVNLTLENVKGLLYIQRERKRNKFIVELYNLFSLKSVKKALDLLVAPSKCKGKKN